VYCQLNIAICDHGNTHYHYNGFPGCRALASGPLRLHGNLRTWLELHFTVTSQECWRQYSGIMKLTI